MSKNSEAAKKRMAEIPKDVLVKRMKANAKKRWANVSPEERKRINKRLLKARKEKLGY